MGLLLYRLTVAAFAVALVIGPIMGAPVVLPPPPVREQPGHEGAVV